MRSATAGALHGRCFGGSRATLEQVDRRGDGDGEPEAGVAVVAAEQQQQASQQRDEHRHDPGDARHGHRRSLLRMLRARRGARRARATLSAPIRPKIARESRRRRGWRSSASGVSVKYSVFSRTRRAQVTKSELVDQVADRADLTKQDAARAIEAVIATVEDALRRGSEVTVAGFGKFHVSDRGARMGVNPRTGERIQIPASRVPRFTAGSGLKSAVKGR